MAGHAIHSANAPAAIGPYSQAVQIENLVFLSGQIPLDPQTMEMVNTSFEAEVRQVFANITSVLEAANASIEDVVKFTVFLTDISNFDQVNSVMNEICNQPFPARSALGVASLPKGANIEIETIAYVKE